MSKSVCYAMEEEEKNCWMLCVRILHLFVSSIFMNTEAQFLLYGIEKVTLLSGISALFLVVLRTSTKYLTSIDCVKNVR